ncbi:uncharacterized protein G2W53_013831 [Senna tora]|uniref:Uncharacterized protein n=1 Tax=Senna tora TaxID=362788 RepID=A0A834WRF6_9FABA|nr:uncharacterized protein G2W53_013831 [Senna tora]
MAKKDHQISEKGPQNHPERRGRRIAR